MESWKKEYEKQFGEYIKNVNIGRYDQNGVNTGWISAKDLLKDFISQGLAKAREEGYEMGIKSGLMGAGREIKDLLDKHTYNLNDPSEVTQNYAIDPEIIEEYIDRLFYNLKGSK